MENHPDPDGKVVDFVEVRDCGWDLVCGLSSDMVGDAAGVYWNGGVFGAWCAVSLRGKQKPGAASLTSDNVWVSHVRLSRI